MKRYTHIVRLAVIGAVLLLVAACSTKKNTAGARFWHSFTTRYNVYYNGNEAYKEGCLAQEKGNKDNYTEQIPVFTVGNEKTRTTGKSSFETAITKCKKAIHLHSIKRRPVVAASKRNNPKMKAYLNRKEFNPFLKNAWLLMAKAQFQQGEFFEAAATFSYITRHYAAEPAVLNEARIWLARCYAQVDWFYDAEDALSKLNRDSISPRLYKERDATTADLLLRQGQLKEALPYLQRTAKKERRKMQKARLYFLLAQVQTELNDKEAAYKAYQKCLRQSPPYEMAFNARIKQTEVMAEGKNGKKMILRLKRMARSEKNKEYLDQVYYAMGNIYLNQSDTLKAIGAYEKGRAESTRSGVEKGILLLRLGEIYWELGRYDRAQSCYGDALGLIEKTHKNYDGITRRSKVLDELVPFTSAIHLQDSLLALSVADEATRNAAIDRVIEELKRKEEEERRAQKEADAEQRKQNNAAHNGRQNTTTTQKTDIGNKEWYFYNPLMVTQGKQDFRKIWGQRKNEDNWRRSNRSVLAAESEEYDYAAEDSLANTDEATEDSVATSTEKTDSAANDPHERAYYLSQIPFSEEAKTACHEIIKDGLYNAAAIEKDKLEDFPLAAKTYNRLITDYPDFDKMEEVYYQLFLLYSRWGRPEEAERYKHLMATNYPESAITKLINDPDFEHNARYGKAIEDSLYTATYKAYRERNNAEVANNFALSTEKFPKGANRPKFMFVHALSRLGTAENKDIIEELRTLVKEYPESDVSELAGMMVKGLESGKTLGEGGFDVGSLWSRRSSTANAAVDSTGSVRGLSDERNTPFVCIIAYPTDSLNDGQLLYDLAHFNFTGFVVRNFDLSQLRDSEITQLRIAGFRNFEEAYSYAQQLYTDKPLAEKLAHARLVIISETNMELLGSTYSFDDYRDFYEKTFAPLKPETQMPLDMQDMPIEQHYEDEYTPEQLDEQQNGGEEDDGGEWYVP